MRVRMLGLWLLCQLAGTVAALWMLAAIVVGSTRAWSLAVGYDQLANAAFGGDPGETISSRAGKAARNGRRWGCILCRMLSRIDPDHCEKSLEPDEGRALDPPRV